MSENIGHPDETSGSTRREFMSQAALAGAAVSIAAPAAQAAPAGQPGVPWDSNGRMGIGINLEYVRHADKSLDYGIKRAGDLGYKWVEPCFYDGRCLLANAGYCHVTSFDTDPEAIKDMCQEAGVQISGLSSHSDLLNPEYGVQYARRGIRYARALDVKVVQICETMHPPKWIDEAEAYNMMRINLRAISETCEENGVCIAIEQHGPYTAKIEHMSRILSLVDSPWIKCNYDCGNTFLAGSDPYEMLDAVIGKVVHVHAKDISVKQAEAERGKVTGTAVGCACGDGVIDWERLVGRLKKADYKGVLSVECGTEDEAIRSLAHLTKVLQELEA
jgi:sugar phosphate isomerase/epimerase